jgi:hypothetical protein
MLKPQRGQLRHGLAGGQSVIKNRPHRACDLARQLSHAPDGRWYRFATWPAKHTLTRLSGGAHRALRPQNGWARLLTDGSRADRWGRHAHIGQEAGAEFRPPKVEANDLRSYTDLRGYQRVGRNAPPFELDLPGRSRDEQPRDRPTCGVTSRQRAQRPVGAPVSLIVIALGLEVIERDRSPSRCDPEPRATISDHSPLYA